MLLQHHLELAIRAHNGTSFSPEKRGQQYIKDYSEQLEKDLEMVAEKGGDVTEYQAKYERLFASWMYAKGSCLSWMITGPSKFPTRRAEKANRSEQNRYEEFHQFRQKYFARIEKNARREAKAASDPLAEMRAKLERAEKVQVLMVAANKVVNKKGVNDEEKVLGLQSLGFTEAQARELLTPDWCKRKGFPSYRLTNNNANIHRMRDRVKELEKKTTAETKEVERADGITVTENAEADRLQIFFPGKPAPEMITTLKKNGFKWSPTNGCWQRQLTENARYAARKILS